MGSPLSRFRECIKTSVSELQMRTKSKTSAKPKSRRKESCINCIYISLIPSTTVFNSANLHFFALFYPLQRFQCNATLSRKCGSNVLLGCGILYSRTHRCLSHASNGGDTMYRFIWNPFGLCCARFWFSPQENGGKIKVVHIGA